VAETLYVRVVGAHTQAGSVGQLQQPADQLDGRHLNHVAQRLRRAVGALDDANPEHPVLSTTEAHGHRKFARGPQSLHRRTQHLKHCCAGVAVERREARPVSERAIATPSGRSVVKRSEIRRDPVTTSGGPRLTMSFYPSATRAARVSTHEAIAEAVVVSIPGAQASTNPSDARDARCLAVAGCGRIGFSNTLFSVPSASGEARDHRLTRSLGLAAAR